MPDVASIPASSSYVHCFGIHNDILFCEYKLRNGGVACFDYPGIPPALAISYFNLGLVMPSHGHWARLFCHPSPKRLIQCPCAGIIQAGGGVGGGVFGVPTPACANPVPVILQATLSNQFPSSFWDTTPLPNFQFAGTTSDFSGNLLCWSLGGTPSGDYLMSTGSGHLQFCWDSNLNNFVMSYYYTSLGGGGTTQPAISYQCDPFEIVFDQITLAVNEFTTVAATLTLSAP